MHDNAPAYALDALGEAEQRKFKAHLASCSRCRRQVAEFQRTASALAYDAEPVEAPAVLERRILLAVGAERDRISRRQGRRFSAAGLAAAAAAVAIGLGFWATQLSQSLSDERSARRADARAMAILADPDARTVPLASGRGKLVVAPGGEAVLAASGLPKAAEGKTYEAWVVRTGRPRPAGLFRGGAGDSVVVLTERAPRASVVGVTVEDAGGSPKPTTPMILRAKA
jgi:anti-sigma-K factor RskA